MTGGLLHLFSRKERAKRKQQSQQAAQLAPPQVPPAYRSDFYEPLNGPRSAYPRPLSSFAPDHRRQAHPGQNHAYGAYYYPHQSGQYGQYSHQQAYQYHHQNPQQQLPRASFDVPRYPALPAYDPSKYQTIQPSLTPTADRLAFHYPNARAQPSRLNEVHYNDARPLSIYGQPPPAAAPDLSSAPPMPQRRMAGHARTQSIMPFSSGASAEHRSSGSGDGRERSVSEPIPAGDGQGNRGPRRPKPVLSRLITNFS